jgi:hypothetical protein
VANVFDIKVIDNHSVAVDLLTKGPVLDAGARGFVFAKWFADRGHSVYALDPSPDLEAPKNDNIAFIDFALTSLYGSALLDRTGDPGAWHLANSGLPVQTVSLSYFNEGNWDVIKLNIEGSEYDVLNTWPGPIARQIVVSFHEHTNRARGRAECDRLIDKMRQWYMPFNVVWEERYCCHANYWDVLFIRKDLA